MRTINKLVFSLCVAMAVSFSASAQWCLSNSKEQMIKKDPLLTKEQKREILEKLPAIIEAERKAAKAELNRNTKADKIIIPVVVHVLHQGGAENLSNEDVTWAIDQMNLDFAHTNPNRDDIMPEFQSLIEDAGIEFRLATIDPDGNCTNGITRHRMSNVYFSSQGEIEPLKNQIHWDVDRYFNVYTVGSIATSGNSTTLGYATFPFYMNVPTLKNRYGFVAVYEDFVKNAGTTSGVGTHEFGHNFNLSHIWGNGEVAEAGNCSGDDGISDTPNTIGNFSTCVKGVVNCGSVDNVQNYMDYSFCFANFTKEQNAEMRSAINQYLGTLITPANLTSTGADYTNLSEVTALCEASFLVDGEEEVVICPGTSLEFTDLSYHNPTSWSWTFEGGTPASSSMQNPTITYNTPGEYAVTLEISNASGSKSNTVTKMVRVVNDLGKAFPILEGFEAYNSNADLDLFEVLNPDGNNGFEITSAAAYTGSKSIYLKNIGQGANFIDAISSARLDISDYDKATDMRFNFKYAFTGRNSSHTDELRVAYSDDCGETWKTRKTISGAALETASTTGSGFVPANQAEWKEASVTVIGVTLNADFRIRFEFTSSAAGNNLYIDDINIYHKDEVGVSEKTNLSNSISVYPIPAKQVANINIQVAKTANYAVDVLDVTGRVVSTITNETLTTGSHKLNVDVSAYTNGVYFIRINANNESVVKRMIVSK